MAAVYSRSVGRITTCPLPDDALLRKYAATGAFTDCYTTTIASRASQADFVEAFYTTFVFRMERLLLRLFVSRPSTDREAAELGRGERQDFAAWTVEQRTASQLLMCDFMGRTRSWLMTAPEGAGTRLYFGSAIGPERDPVTGERRMGGGFSALMGFHRLYSRVLLRTAARRVSRV